MKKWQIGLWTKVQSLGFLVFVVVVAIGVSLMFLPVLRQRHSMQQYIHRLDHEIAQQQAIERQQQSDIEALQTDPTYVERTARNKLNLARPNEMVFRFEPPPAMAVPAKPRR